MGQPVYPAETGSLAKLLKINPEIRDAQFVPAGQLIRLPALENRIPASSGEAAEAPSKTQDSPQSDFGSAKFNFESSDSDFGFSQVRLGTRTYYSKLGGYEAVNSSHGSLLSGLTPALFGRWTFFWTEHWSTFVGADLDRVTMESSSATQVQNATKYLTGLNAGLEYRTDSSELGLKLQSKDVLVYRVLGLSSVQLDSVRQSALALTGEKTWVRAGKIRGGLSSEISASMPVAQGVYSTQLGWGFEAAAFASQSMRSGNEFTTHLFYRMEQTPVSQGSYTNTSLGLRFFWNWNLK